MGYSKLDHDFWSSSICDAPPYARLLFMALWALCDENGEFRATLPSMARHANLPLPDVEDSIKILSAPDPYSSSQEYGGRRVIEVSPNTWRVVNFEKYRDRDHVDGRREYWRNYKRKKAAEKLLKVEESFSGGGSAVSVPEVKPKAPAAKSKRNIFCPPTIDEVREFFRDRALPLIEADKFWRYFENCGWRLSGGKGAVMKDWKLAAQNWASDRHVGGSVSRETKSPSARKPTHNVDFWLKNVSNPCMECPSCEQGGKCSVNQDAIVRMAIENGVKVDRRFDEDEWREIVFGV